MLARCLDALVKELGEGDEIVVADSASADPAVVVAAAKRPDTAIDVRVERCDKAGASLARNRGWRAARHELIAFVDDDVRVRPGWADALVAAFDDPVSDNPVSDKPVSDKPVVEFVTGRVVVPEDQQDAERPVAISSRTERELLHPGLSGDLGASANLAVRRRALDRIGGFDETLGPGTWSSSAEDLDLIDRLFQAGFAGLFEPAAIAEHDQWRSRSQLVALDWSYGKGMGIRIARLARHDRARARRLLREAVIEQGVRPVLDDLRHGYEFGAITVATRTLATLLGLVLGTVGVWLRHPMGSRG
jgi:glycosyltransferase involved in cell wall biosynthesis